MANKKPFSHKILIWFLAICLVALLLTSLYQRFKNPDIIIHIAANPDTSANMQSNESMERIGPLMQAVAKDPENQKLILELVEALISINQWESAENFTRKALALNKIDNPDPRALYFSAIIHHKKGEYSQAAELLEQLLKRTENPSARFNLGVLYFYYLDNAEKAVMHLQKGINYSETPENLKKAMVEELTKITEQIRK